MSSCDDPAQLEARPRRCFRHRGVLCVLCVLCGTKIADHVSDLFDGGVAVAVVVIVGAAILVRARAKR